MTTDQILETRKDKMNKTAAALKKDFSTLRAGRANPQLLDRILVDYYGSPTPINQVANISIPEPRIIQSSRPGSRACSRSSKRKSMKCGPGHQPTNDGKIIRLLLPELTEERRKELVQADAQDGSRSARSPCAPSAATPSSSSRR